MTVAPFRDADPTGDPTRTSPDGAAGLSRVPLLALTLLWHPEPGRAGQQAVFADGAEPMWVNRFAPDFHAAGLSEGRPLAHAGVSRTPLQLQPQPDGGLRIYSAGARMPCEVEGEALGAEGRQLTAAEIDAGVVLQLGGEVLLCLHRVSTLPQPHSEGSALIGVSSAMVRVRRQLAQAASSEQPVLLLGESGTGKELAAQAIHAASARRGGPLVSVNMAAMSEGLAAADLFGAARGAYTGAASSRQGLFAEAAGGTLFLDEIGDTPAAVQPMLLRVIESGEYRALGGTQTERADVRLIAATDRDLQAASGFNQPLLRRLEVLVVQLPPLRRRREDLGLLVQHLLEPLLDEATALPRLPAPLLRALFLHDWPGNVRQLGHALRRLVLARQAGEWPSVQELLGGASVPMAVRPTASVAPHAAAPVPVDKARRYRAPSEIGAEELIAALDAQGWCLLDAAAVLGVSRPSLYNLIERHPLVRRADTLSLAEIEAARDALAGEPTLALLATRLRTPREALRRRLRALGMSAPVEGRGGATTRL